MGRWLVVGACALALLLLIGGLPVVARSVATRFGAVAESRHVLASSGPAADASVIGAGLTARSQPRATNPAVQALLDRVDGDRALADLRRISGEVPLCVSTGCVTITNRLTGGDGVGHALDYLVETTTRLGYSVRTHDWTAGQVSGRNVIVSKTGVVSPSEQVFLVAHVDGVDSCPGGRCPAADDNGSGSVAGLEMARVFAAATFKRTVTILFDTGEEEGVLGVQAYIDQTPPDDLADIKYLIDTDMLGYDGNGDKVMELYYGADPPSLRVAQAMSETIAAYQLALIPRLNSDCG
jgi:hypothetical protein